MMQHLSNRDHRLLRDCIGQLYEHDDLDRLKAHLPVAVTGIVPTDRTIFGELDLRRPDLITYRAFPNEEIGFSRERVAMVYQDHPVLRHVKETGYSGALKMTDFLTQRQFHETRMWHEWMRHEEAEYSMNFQVVEPALPFLTTISLMRRNRDFSGTARLKLDILQPHIARAYLHAGRVSSLRLKSALAFDALAVMSQGVVALAAGGAILFCSEPARAYLKCYFNDFTTRNGALPAKLCRWLRQQDLPGRKDGALPLPRRPFVAEQDGKRLTVHLLSGTASRQRLLLLEEQRVKPSVQPLQDHLGLTARRAEVLLWVTQGKTSPEIAVILGLSVGTVTKHLEHIFAHLGVETRTAAALQAMEAMNRG